GNFFVNEDAAEDPNHARLTPETGYFDFVNHHYVQPDMETCYRTFSLTNCGSGELLVRHAFMAIDPNQEQAYQPLSYPDTITVKDDAGRDMMDPKTGEVLREPIFERFGFYRLDRLTYNRQRELTESGKLQRILRFHIWERDVDANGKTIPFAERKPKAI